MFNIEKNRNPKSEKRIEAPHAQINEQASFAATPRHESYETYQERSLRHMVAKRLDTLSEHVTADAQLLSRYLNRFSMYEGGVEYLNEEIIKLSIGEAPLDLPEGYVIKGGLARLTLERALGIQSPEEVRDIDLCYVGENEDRSVSNALAQEYCPEDFSHGYGVESLEDDYFQSRDFTINEVLVYGENILTTRQCLLDTMRGIIRFTDYEKDLADNNNRYVNDKLASKALRLIAQRRGFDGYSFADEDFFGDSYINDFHMALHLDRALGIGEDVAQEFVYELSKRGQIPENIITPQECLNYLVENTDFIFCNGEEREPFDLESRYRDLQQGNIDNPSYLEQKILESEHFLEKYSRSIDRLNNQSK